MSEIAVFIDAPNCFYKNRIDLKKCNELVNSYGRVVIKKAFTTDTAPKKLTEALNNCGFDVSTFFSDIDAPLVAEAMDVLIQDLLNGNKIDTFIIISGDADYSLLVQKLKKYGKKVVIMAIKGKLSSALASLADEIVYVPEFTNDLNVSNDSNET